MDSSIKLQRAAEWLAVNAPGAETLIRCRERFNLRPKHVGEVGRAATEIRSQNYCAKLIDAAKAGAS